MPFLTELLKACKGNVTVQGNADKVAVSSIAYDSRQVTPGALFVAVPGTKADGSIYAMDAVQAGAVAVVTEDPRLILPASCVRILVDNARLALARLAGAFYIPQPACVVAITGTDGKTSTADFFRQLWQMSDRKAASIGTLGLLGEGLAATMPAVQTTPDPVQLHQALQALAKEDCRHVAIEASSHGLHQYRLDGIRLRAAAYTNLTRDHLDYHQTMDAYFLAKLRLFTELLPVSGMAVLNADDFRFERIRAACGERGIKSVSYGLAGKEYRIKKITPTLEGLAVQAEVLGTSQHFMLHMAGAFQVMNAFAALGLYISCEGSVEEGLKHLPHLHNVPGRLERVASHASGAAIFVDYAHTPAALANVLRTLRPHVQGKLTVVFGCGGDRDKGKRPEMGKAASEYADRVVVTDDNPRSEDPQEIRREVLAGAPQAQNIGNRAEAIAFAVESLHKGDVLLIAGKGHEKTQAIGDRTLPFDDAQVARQAAGMAGTDVA